MEKKSRLAEVFQENGNLIGLAGAVGLSAVLLNPIPLILAGVAEAAYLLFVPDSKWYEARLSRRYDAEVAARRAALKDSLLPQFTPELQQRFARLETIRSQIAAQVQNSNDNWVLEVLRKLDYLLEKFLLFAQKDMQFRSYLQSVYQQVVQGRITPVTPTTGSGGSRLQRLLRAATDFDLSDDAPRPSAKNRASSENTTKWVSETVIAIQARYQQEIESITAEETGEQDLNTRAILQKRASVLEQRQEYISKIGKIVVNLEYQMALLEDSFGLINDQIRARTPEQVLADIEGVVYRTDSMTKLLDELAPYESDSSDNSEL